MTAPLSVPARVTNVWPARAILGEGVTWDAASGRVYWLDIKGRQLFSYGHGNGEKQAWALPFRMGSIARPAAGWTAPSGLGSTVFAGCGDRGLVWLGLDGESIRVVEIADPEREIAGNRYNDGKFGPDGRYWAGTMDDAETEARGSLYAFTPSGAADRLDDGYQVTNGPGFSRDGRTVYHADSARQRIYAFDLGLDGKLANKRVFRQFGDGEGYPDGMTVDAAETLWVAMWDGSRVVRLGPDACDLGAVAMPVARPTSVAFVGPSTFYVTSASIGRESEAQAGSLFRVDLEAV